VLKQQLLLNVNAGPGCAFHELGLEVAVGNAESLRHLQATAMARRARQRTDAYRKKKAQQRRARRERNQNACKAARGLGYQHGIALAEALVENVNRKLQKRIDDRLAGAIKRAVVRLEMQRVGEARRAAAAAAAE